MKLTRQQAIDKNKADEREAKERIAKQGIVSGGTLMVGSGIMYGLGNHISKDREGYIKSQGKTILKNLVKSDGYGNISQVPKEAMMGLKERAGRLATENVDRVSGRAKTAGKLALATGAAVTGYSLYKHRKLKKEENQDDNTKKK